MSDLSKINRDQRLYVIKCGAGFTCLGFDYAEKQRRAVLAWIGEEPEPMRKGTKRHYAAYRDAMARGAEHNRKTGKRCPADLTPALIGLEGKRVEVTEPDGEKRRFNVGKSTGWFPCHLEIARRNSSGGMAVYMSEGATVRVVS